VGADLETLIAGITAEMASAPDRGTVAHYIPPLGEVDPLRFGIAVATADGCCFTGGAADSPFSIQSISKVFTLTIALGRLGDRLWNRVGREPSGSAFNSIVQLEHERGIPRNPFVNAGALVLSDAILAGHQPRDAIAEILSFVRSVADDPDVFVDERVAQAEQEVGFRNAALANYLRAFKNLENPVDLVLGVYFHQCAIAMSCRQLALAGRYLMARGTNLATGSRVTSAERARHINALMLTCGHYDGSGDFAFRVGFPAKSGVGGGILAIVPEVASIAVWSPGLNGCGNSQLGTLALERLSRATGWSLFGASGG